MIVQIVTIAIVYGMNMPNNSLHLYTGSYTDYPTPLNYSININYITLMSFTSKSTSILINYLKPTTSIVERLCQESNQ